MIKMRNACVGKNSLYGWSLGSKGEEDGARIVVGWERR